MRDRQAEFISYLNALTTTVADQKTKLEAAKAPAQLLDSVSTITKALERANVEQENSKAGRQADTQARIDRLNQIHKICRQFSDAAEFVFEGNSAKRDLYRLPGNSKPSTEKNQE